MLEVVVSKIIGSFVISMTEALIIKQIINKELKINLKNLLLIILMTIITIVAQYKVNYSSSVTLLIYIIIIFIYKEIFGITYKKSIIVSGLSLLIILLMDIILSIIMTPFISANEIRADNLIFVATNIIICLISYLVVLTKKVKGLLSKFASKIDNNKIYSQYIFVVIMILITSLILFDLSTFFHATSQQYIITVIITVFILILTIIYIKSKNDNDKLQEQFDYLYNYSENYEDWITKEQLNIHENKNQLIVLRDMVKGNQKAVDYINEILEEDFVLEDKWLGQLSNVPKGGLKGLLYYKLIIIEKNNLNFCVDISKNAKIQLKRIQKEQLKDISHMIGIFIDNAIEASKNSKKKMFALEVYCIKKELNIVITNSFNEKIDINKINNKGYSTKGKNRGKGLYFVSKIKEKNPNIKTKTNIINDYFVQRIIIN